MPKLNSLLNLLIFLVTVVILIYLFTFVNKQTSWQAHLVRPSFKNYSNERNVNDDHSQYNLWLIFTKVIEQSPLYFNFKRLIPNILAVSSVPVQLHIITDDASKEIAIGIFDKIEANLNKSKITYQFYDVSRFANNIQDIVEAMTPHFSSRPGTYYSDALFYISLGLYRLAPKNQKLAVMIDCDVHFKQDLWKVFQEFKFFREGELFGLAPELSPVYKHVLYAYKLKHNVTFGEFVHSEEMYESLVHPRGFPGYNSGVVLFNLRAIRESATFEQMITKEAVNEIVKKYSFRGHLGDQDFYTLLGYEHPEMFRTLSCAFNRQLCTWWRENRGYTEIFDKYFKCNEDIVILHGNCNTRISI